MNPISPMPVFGTAGPSPSPLSPKGRGDCFPSPALRERARVRVGLNFFPDYFSSWPRPTLLLAMHAVTGTPDGRLGTGRVHPCTKAFERCMNAPYLLAWCRLPARRNRIIPTACVGVSLHNSLRLMKIFSMNFDFHDFFTLFLTLRLRAAWKMTIVRCCANQ
jgi:hypothetical protein